LAGPAPGKSGEEVRRSAALGTSLDGSLFAASYVDTPMNEVVAALVKFLNLHWEKASTTEARFHDGDRT
jgi:hypothetical protein